MIWNCYSENSKFIATYFLKEDIELKMQASEWNDKW